MSLDTYTHTLTHSPILTIKPPTAGVRQVNHTRIITTGIDTFLHTVWLLCHLTLAVMTKMLYL